MWHVDVWAQATAGLFGALTDQEREEANEAILATTDEERRRALRAMAY
jgi:hypothetical protein